MYWNLARIDENHAVEESPILGALSRIGLPVPEDVPRKRMSITVDVTRSTNRRIEDADRSNDEPNVLK